MFDDILGKDKKDVVKKWEKVLDRKSDNSKVEGTTGWVLNEKGNLKWESKKITRKIQEAYDEIKEKDSNKEKINIVNAFRLWIGLHSCKVIVIMKNKNMILQGLEHDLRTICGNKVGIRRALLSFEKSLLNNVSLTNRNPAPIEYWKAYWEWRKQNVR